MVEEHAGCETAGIGVMQKFSPFPKPPFKISVFNKLCQVCFIRRLQQGVCVVLFFFCCFFTKKGPFILDICIPLCFCGTGLILVLEYICIKVLFLSSQ